MTSVLISYEEESQHDQWRQRSKSYGHKSRNADDHQKRGGKRTETDSPLGSWERVCVALPDFAFLDPKTVRK